MQQEILNHLQDPMQLEKMYRANKSNFKRSFEQLYPEIKDNMVAEYWHARLNYEADDINWGTQRDIVWIIGAALVAGFIAKLPSVFGFNADFFYPRNLGFILFPVLTAWFAWKNKLRINYIIIISACFIVGLVFINLLPNVQESDTLLLSCIHVVLFQWSLLGFAFVGTTQDRNQQVLAFLKYNGDLLVMTALIAIAGAILTGITIGLFNLIGFNIEEFYFQNIVVFALPAAPIIGTFLVQTNPQLVGKVSPVIAKIFCPVVLVMLIIYLGAMVYGGKDPYNDREFLLVFNALLVGVMAIIFFSIAENNGGKSAAETWILFLLAIVTMIVNTIALSAILFRISEWGLTPNRAAILGMNILMLAHLVMVVVQLYKVVAKKIALNAVGKAIGWFMPLYVAWFIIVTFLFPLLFGFK